MTNAVRTESRYVDGVGADTLYQTNMVECHRAFPISQWAKRPYILFASLMTSTHGITIASSMMIRRMQMRAQKTPATAMRR
jgi:hypothetical protein